MMIVRRNWMIVVLLLAGGLYYWLSKGPPPEPEKVPQQAFQQHPTYRPASPQPPMDSSRSPLSGPGSLYPPRSATPFTAPRFRPLPNSTRPEDDLQPLLRYPGGTSYEGDAAIAPDFPTYDSSYQPQAPAAPEYRFRPQEFKGKSRRWTGNYPQYPGNGQVAPMRPSGPQSPLPAKPWQQATPPPSSAGQNPLWADTLTPRR